MTNLLLNNGQSMNEAYGIVVFVYLAEVKVEEFVGINVRVVCLLLACNVVGM